MPSKRGKSRKVPVPFPWDSRSDSNRKRIEENYRHLRAEVVQSGLARNRPTPALVQGWHARSLDGIRLAEPWVAGHYRGEGPSGSQLRDALVHVGGRLGEPPAHVRQRVRGMFEELDRRIDGLDARVSVGEGLNTLYPDVLQLCAWAHGEWIRIHPFVDHNGSTARLLALMLGLRYGVPLNLPGKPRPPTPSFGLALSYNVAAENQMMGDDTVMVSYLDRLARASAAQHRGQGV
ncbi:hypothetical protein GCM10025788_26440 [Serinicoccus chungangensis]